MRADVEILGDRSDGGDAVVQCKNVSYGSFEQLLRQ